MHNYPHIFLNWSGNLARVLGDEACGLSLMKGMGNVAPIGALRRLLSAKAVIFANIRGMIIDKRQTGVSRAAMLKEALLIPV